MWFTGESRYSASAGSSFHGLIVLFTKEHLPISVLCFLDSSSPRPHCLLGKTSLYPLKKRLCGPQSRSGIFRKDKPLPLPGIETRFLGRAVRRHGTALSILYFDKRCSNSCIQQTDRQIRHMFGTFRCERTERGTWYQPWHLCMSYRIQR